MKYQIDIKGLQEMISRLEASTKESLIKSSLTYSGKRIETWIVKNRLSGPRPNVLGRVTGRLASSVTSGNAEKNGDEYSVKIGTNVKYAPIHEFGGTIKPGTKGFLAWKSRDTGKYIFTRKPVKIPARPFLRPALDNKENIQNVLNDLTERINEALTK